MIARGWIFVPRAMGAFALGSFALAPFAGGCNAGDDPVDEDAVVACDALSAPEQAIELGDVLAAGRAADGQVYVLSETDDGELLAFVSEDGVLQRRRVLGEGSGNEGSKTSRQATVEGAPAFTLYLETSADGVIVFVRTESEERIVSLDDIDAAEMLELLAEDELTDLEPSNLAPLVWIEYFGTLDDDRRVLVVRPADDWAFEDFRVFLGTPDRMLERDVGDVVRARDGGSTTIELTIDGEAAVLDFPIESTDDGGFGPGPAVLERGGERFAIELDAEPDRSELEDLEYFCRSSAPIGGDTGETAYRPVD
jgi:hypothetical protein